MKPMKLPITLIAGTITIFILSNCAQPAGPNTQRGIATGGLAGAAVGGVIGHQSGRGLEGAAIGAAGGAVAGGLFGNARDQEQGSHLRRHKR